MNFMTATVKVTADTVALFRQLAKAKAGVLAVTRGMSRAFKAVRRVITSVTIGVVALTAATVTAVLKITSIASAAEEIQAKFDTVFKKLAFSANQWAEDFGAAVGRAKQNVKEWMARLQDTFVPLGMTRTKAFELSKSLVKLAVDVASFNNKADPDVIRDFVGALMGSTETVRKYGVILDEVAMKNERLIQGITTQFKDLSALEKVTLRYNILLKATADAQGDAIRTGDSYANQVKRLKANLTDLGEMLGAIFLPAMTTGVTALNRWIITNREAIAEFVERAWIKLNWLRARVMHMWDNLDWKDRFKGMGLALVEVMKGALISVGLLAGGLVDVIKKNILGGHDKEIWEAAEKRFIRETGVIPSQLITGAQLPGRRRFTPSGGLSGKEITDRIKGIADELEVTATLTQQGVFKSVGRAMEKAVLAATAKVDELAGGEDDKRYRSEVIRINKELVDQLQALRDKFSESLQVQDPGALPLDTEAVTSAANNLQHMEDLKTAAEKLKETLITPVEKLRKFGKQLREMVTAQHLTEKEGLKLFRMRRALLFPKDPEKVRRNVGGSMSFQRSLIDLEALSVDEESSLKEQRITNELLRRIERKKSLGI